MTVVVISGVSQGLGRAMAEGFSAAGCIVCGCARSAAAIQDLKQQLGSVHHFDVVDVTSDQKVAAWAKRVVERTGPPDFLINNAAIINSNAPLWEVSAAEFSSVTDVNINGTANLIRHFVPSMLSRSRGVVVNFSSGWGRVGSADVAPYCASKWAIEGLTRSLAQELPDGMAAVALNPGIISTEMLSSCFGDAAMHYPAPDDWAAVAVPYILNLGPKDNGQPLSVPGM
ncbi:MAG: SDR family oxidoreductase [Fuerstiella sp.]